MVKFNSSVKIRVKERVWVWISIRDRVNIRFRVRVVTETHHQSYTTLAFCYSQISVSSVWERYSLEAILSNKKFFLDDVNNYECNDSFPVARVVALHQVHCTVSWPKVTEATG